MVQLTPPAAIRRKRDHAASQQSRVAACDPRSLADAELLAILLGPTRRRRANDLSPHQLAVRLIEHCGGLANLYEHGVGGLSTCEGVSSQRAARVMAALELGRRSCQSRSAAPLLASHEDVYDWSRARLTDLAHEEVWLLCVDGRNRLKSAERVGQGGVHGCGLTPADVLRPAVRTAASAAILVHNHPSGDPTPSDQDLVMTRVVARAFDLVGIPLLDHVVVARDRSASVAALAPKRVLLDTAPDSGSR